jgi:hypothetical protein
LRIVASEIAFAVPASAAGVEEAIHLSKPAPTSPRPAALAAFRNHARSAGLSALRLMRSFTYFFPNIPIPPIWSLWLSRGSSSLGQFLEHLDLVLLRAGH